MKRLTGVWAALVFALVLAATAGSALAENPHNPSSPPGNSGTAPGQQKKDEAAATATIVATPAAQPAQAGPGQSDSAPGQEKKSTAQPASTQQQSTASADAKASHTAADGSKQYGNGKTALEIAKQTKASITINDLSEPGNSGKHKVTICHNGHLITVDVHALPAHARHLDGSDVIPATSASQCSQSTPEGATQTQSAVCGSVTTTSTSTKVQNGHAYGRVKHGKSLHTTTVTKTETTPTGEVCGTSGAILSSVVTVFGSAGNGSGTSGGTSAGTSGGTSGSSTSNGSGAAGTGGVAGISASLGSGQQKGGVLGIAATRVKGALPFTGFALWIAVLIGASLLIGGVALRRRTRGLNAT